MSQKHFSFSRFAYTFLIVFLIWYAFTTSLQIAEIITGIFLSLIVAYITVVNFDCCDPILITPSHIGYFIQYFFVFLVALVKANFDVAKRVINPKLPINPGIVSFETKLTNDFAKMVLANSITLTPGTLTVDVIGNRFFVHWIDVTTQNKEEVYKEIAAPFEKVLLKIYGS
jgi:multicomponent Na+:H+ antiporter subunit E